MEKKLNRFGLSSPTRVELLIVLLLVFLVPLTYLKSQGVLGTSTVNNTEIKKTGQPSETSPKPSPSASAEPKLCKEGAVNKFAVSDICGPEKYKSVT